MTVFTSILVPLDGSSLATRSLGCATWLAARLHARLHVLSAQAPARAAREELARLRVPEAHWPLVTLHQAPSYPEDAILAAVDRHGVDLVVITASGRTAEARAADGPLLGHVARAVVEGSRVPVLLLPPNYREALPWTRVLVPVSGEPQADEALAFAVRLAEAIDLTVHVAHVSDADPHEASLHARARYADALHHEYHRQLDELVARALPLCERAECRRIEDVALCRGDIAAELLTVIERRGVDVVVVGWHGRLEPGRARVVRRLLERLTIPLLLVKPPARAPFRLAIGEDLE